jgi:hypothetical protein
MITGHVAVTDADDFVMSPAPPDTYLGVAESMLTGAQALAVSGPSSAMALALVCSHVLECFLKASLTRRRPKLHSKKKAETEVMKSHKRHNIAWLWTAASRRGLAITRVPPPWAKRLSEVHAHPYYLRYSTGVHGVVLPGAEPMVSELSALAKLVREQVTR